MNEQDPEVLRMLRQNNVILKGMIRGIRRELVPDTDAFTKDGPLMREETDEEYAERVSPHVTVLAIVREGDKFVAHEASTTFIASAIIARTHKLAYSEAFFTKASYLEVRVMYMDPPLMMCPDCEIRMRLSIQK